MTPDTINNCFNGHPVAIYNQGLPTVYLGANGERITEEEWNRLCGEGAEEPVMPPNVPQFTREQIEHLCRMSGVYLRTRAYDEIGFDKVTELDVLRVVFEAGRAAALEEAARAVIATQDKSGVNDDGRAWLMRATRSDYVSAIRALSTKLDK